MVLPRRFIVNLDAAWRLVIVNRDGLDFTEEDRKFVADAISSALRGRGLDRFNEERDAAMNEAIPEGGRREAVTRGGVRFEIDPYIIEIDERRKLVPGLTKRQLSRDVGWWDGKFQSFYRGQARPQLYEIRELGAVPGINLVPMLIPTALVKRIRELKELFFRGEDESESPIE